MKYSAQEIARLEEKARAIRRGTLECMGIGVAGHVGLSLIHIYG